MYKEDAALQPVCSEAFWHLFESLFERVPNILRSCSERLRNKPLPEGALTGDTFVWT